MSSSLSLTSSIIWFKHDNEHCWHQAFCQVIINLLNYSYINNLSNGTKTICSGLPAALLRKSWINNNQSRSSGIQNRDSPNESISTRSRLSANNLREIFYHDDSNLVCSGNGSFSRQDNESYISFGIPLIGSELSLSMEITQLKYAKKCIKQNNKYCTQK